jgi:hypothetical protein
MGLIGWLVYPSCSHLEHRALVKRFVSLQFLNLRHSVGLLGLVISPPQGRYLPQTEYFYDMHPVVYLLDNIYLSVGQSIQQLLQYI